MLKTALYISLFFAFLAISSCSIDSFENSSAPITDEETQIAGQIIGESISENQSGILSTFSEAFAVPTPSGLENGPSLLSTGSFRNLETYSYSFDTESNEHRVFFTIGRETPLLSSATDVSLSYIFYDSGGNPIEFPADQKERIDAVDFSSEQSGTITTGSKNSVFSRTDRIIMSGISSNSGLLTLDGFHSGTGNFSAVSLSGATIQREYALDMNYLNIQIDKATVQSNRNFRSGVTGALSYESTVRDVSSETGSTKIVNGTIELNGDGTALLNFREQPEPIRLRLDDGDLFDEDEFEGRIIDLNLQNRVITIANGQRIEINNRTQIEDSDYPTLESVADAIASNRRVVAEGDYIHPDESVNLWIATAVSFEEESNEFEDLISSFNLFENRFTLLNGDQMLLVEQSEVDFEDDLNSLQEVSDAVAAGLPVLAEGEFSVNPESGDRIVTDVEFGLEFDEFDAMVSAADSLNGTFTLDDIRQVQVTPQTRFDGDFGSIAAVEKALAQGILITASGEYYLGESGEIWIAVEVSFEEKDDDDNGDGDGDSGDDDGDGGTDDGDDNTTEVD